MTVLRWLGYIALGVVGLAAWEIVVSWSEARQHRKEDEKWERRLGISLSQPVREEGEKE